ACRAWRVRVKTSGGGLLIGYVHLGGSKAREGLGLLPVTDYNRHLYQKVRRFDKRWRTLSGVGY
ncbi:hypothetical protein J2R62_17825, partial [Plesiomonas shigelloides]